MLSFKIDTLMLYRSSCGLGRSGFVLICYPIRSAFNGFGHHQTRNLIIKPDPNNSIIHGLDCVGFTDYV